MDKGRYEYYKGQLYGILVSLTEGGSEARAVLKGFEDRGEELDGFRGLLALHERFDVQTTSSMLQAFLEVVKPGGIKGDKDMVGAISRWETLVGALENRFGEVISENLKTAILVGMLPKEYHDMVIEKGILMGGGKLRYQECKDYLVKMAKEKSDRARPVPMEVGAAESGLVEGLGNYDEIGYGGMGDLPFLAALGKGSGCFICGGNHFQRECPYKGKGKGKGGWKGVWGYGKADWLKGSSKGGMKGLVTEGMVKGGFEKGKGKGFGTKADNEVKGGIGKGVGGSSKGMVKGCGHGAHRQG